MNRREDHKKTVGVLSARIIEHSALFEKATGDEKSKEMGERMVRVMEVRESEQ